MSPCTEPRGFLPGRQAHEIAGRWRLVGTGGCLSPAGPEARPHAPRPAVRGCVIVQGPLPCLGDLGRMCHVRVLRSPDEQHDAAA